MKIFQKADKSPIDDELDARGRELERRRRELDAFNEKRLGLQTAVQTARASVEGQRERLELINRDVQVMALLDEDEFAAEQRELRDRLRAQARGETELSEFLTQHPDLDAQLGALDADERDLRHERLRHQARGKVRELLAISAKVSELQSELDVIANHPDAGPLARGIGFPGGVFSRDKGDPRPESAAMIYAAMRLAVAQQFGADLLDPSDAVLQTLERSRFDSFAVSARSLNYLG